MNDTAGDAEETGVEAHETVELDEAIEAHETVELDEAIEARDAIETRETIEARETIETHEAIEAARHPLREIRPARRRRFEQRRILEASPRRRLDTLGDRVSRPAVGAVRRADRR